jgi:hypothetical protein
MRKAQQHGHFGALGNDPDPCAVSEAEAICIERIQINL